MLQANTESSYFSFSAPLVVFVLLSECVARLSGPAAPKLTLLFGVSGLWWPGAAYANL